LAEDGIWYLDLTPESYKTGKFYLDQRIPIVNTVFEDGTCFYDYLEMWLYGYYLGKDGSPRSCGSSCPDLEAISCWYASRMLFQPKHDFFFTQYNGKPTQKGGLGRYFSTAVHNMTGQRLNPHLLRDIYATYFLEQGYPDDVIRSLAYAMGHRFETLHRKYDKRNPQQKRRPVEKAMLDIIQQSLNSFTKVNLDYLTPKEQVLNLIPQLTPKERQELKLSL